MSCSSGTATARSSPCTSPRDAPERVRALVLSGTCAYRAYHLPWKARLLSSWVGRLLAPSYPCVSIEHEYRAQFADPSARQPGADRRGAGRVRRSRPAVAAVAASAPTRFRRTSRIAARPHLGAGAAAVGSERPCNAADLGSPPRAGPPDARLESSTTAATIRRSSSPRRSARSTSEFVADARLRSPNDSLTHRFTSRRRGPRTPPPTARDGGHRGTARRCAAGRSRPSRPFAGSASNAQTVLRRIARGP